MLVPKVGTTLSFGDSEWKEPGVVFVTMAKGCLARGSAREDKNYSATIHIAVVKESGITGEDNNI